MTVDFLGNSLTIELRNGVGSDIEFANARPVWISRSGGHKLEVAGFEGILISLPFCLLSYGRCYLEED